MWWVGEAIMCTRFLTSFERYQASEAYLCRWTTLSICFFHVHLELKRCVIVYTLAVYFTSCHCLRPCTIGYLSTCRYISSPHLLYWNKCSTTIDYTHAVWMAIAIIIHWRNWSTLSVNKEYRWTMPKRVSRRRNAGEINDFIVTHKESYHTPH